MNSETLPNRNETLWQQAHQRVAFRRKALTYSLLLLFLTAVWYFSNPRAPFWPAWAALGFGISLAMRFVKAYFPQVGSVETEYRKLSENQPK